MFALPYYKVTAGWENFGNDIFICREVYTSVKAGFGNCVGLYMIRHNAKNA